MQNRREQYRKESRFIYGGLALLAGIGVGLHFLLTGPKTEPVQPTKTSPDTVKQPTYHSYVIKKGDYLSKIANNLGLELDSLKKYNPQIENWNRLEIGDSLKYKSK